MRDFLRVGLLLPAALMSACVCGQGKIPDLTSSSSSSGGDNGPCAIDCSGIPTPPCTEAVCNTGKYVGPLNTCVVIPVENGMPCDDGKFCTTDDACNNGTCVGGTQNNCGMDASPCVAVICYEESKSCSSTPVGDGTPCTPTDLCQVNGACHVGACVGQPKDCSFSPVNECSKATCDSTTGKCVGTADPTKDGKSCVLTGDLCSTGKTCMGGQCAGGKPKDCSAFNVGCQVGQCNPTTGICDKTNAPPGTACTQGIAQCHLGACDIEGACSDSGAAPDGDACNDHNACTDGKTCSAGACSPMPIAGCSLYLFEGFEVCPDGWTLGGDWQCGTPAKTSPVLPHSGNGVIATQLSGLYHVNQSFDTCDADSPVIDLTKATNPQLSFWRWDHTEGGTFDGWNLKISTDNGATYTEVVNVTPAYNLMILSQPSWGGDHSTEGWQNYFADLTAFAGQKVKLRFAFRSDAATVFTGVYIDDVVVAEPSQIPLYITTSSPLPDVYAGQFYSVPLAKVGGTSSSVWSIKPGGTNTSWLSIDANGVLSGTPTAANVGPVSVTVGVAESLSNFDEKTFTFRVDPDVYYTSFEGTCPAGWTLTGDWQCGTPSKVGPATAYAGMQCIGTGMGADYNNGDTWANTTATSPDIALTGVQNPMLTFRMWLDTEGSHDGANLEISTDGGATYSVLTNTLPPYAGTIDGEGAWSGHQAAYGWQLVQVDLSAYANKTIRLRFAFDSDTSGTYSGVFIDDVLIN